MTQDGNPPQEERIDFVNVEDEMRSSYIDYSMSVIIGRALPDARDGLKPVNRRILFAMREGGFTHTRPYTKCARVVGEVMGKYHPHGDSAVYDTLVRMAQNFSLRSPLIDGQGNFGSIDGDPPAAYRYTECRLNHLAEELLADIDKNTVDMRPNFDEKLNEPVVLPTRVPNLLVNGSTGIAVGMATNIPPHNLREVVNATIYLIDHPDAEVTDLFEFIKGPDFPTGGMVRGMSPIRNMYLTGRGLIRMRGRAEVFENEREKDTIIITEIPYAVNKASMIERMAQLVTEKKLEGISDIRDESNKDGIRVVIELKRGVIGSVILNNLYKQTQLESTFGAIMLAIDDGRPKLMNLKELLNCFIKHRFEVITRRTRYELDKAEARAHILEGLRIALDNLDEVVKTIRASKNREEAQSQLMAKFSLSELQTKAILDMRLYQLTGLERDKIEAEYNQIMIQIAYLKDLLEHDHKIYDLIKTDLGEIREQYGDDRRTEILQDDSDINIEDLIADSPCVITISHTGYIKRVPTDTYREQRRGGKGVKGMSTKDEDFVEHVFSASAHDYILFFTEKGRVYWKKVYEIPEATRTSRGKAMVNFLEINNEEKVAAMIRVREFVDTEHLVFSTRKGTVKRTNLAAFGNPRAGGIIAIRIDEDDLLMGVRRTTGDNDVMLVTHNGMSIRFNENHLRDQGRATRGVRGIRLKSKDDFVVSIEIVNENEALLVVSENGYGKRTAFDEYPIRNRGGSGVITLRTSDRNGKVVSAHSVPEDGAMMLITQGGIMIRMGLEDLRVISRNTQGVRMINLDKGDVLVSATPVEREEDVDEETPEGEVENAEATTTAGDAGDAEATDVEPEAEVEATEEEPEEEGDAE